MATKLQGRITDFEGKYYLVDADPHVMARVRRLFDSGVNHCEAGFHTHKPVRITKSRAAARDIVWLIDRYPLQIEQPLHGEILAAAAEYERLLAEVAAADSDPVFKASDGALELALPLRDHQIRYNNMQRKMRRMMLADKMGMGKTPAAISLFCEESARPAMVVAPTHLVGHWAREIARFLPSAKVHVIPGFKTYQIPSCDVVVTSYNRLRPWQDTLIRPETVFKTVVFDEVQELRHTDTGKRDVARAISQRAEMVTGLTGTPIYNYGSEIWSVMDAIAPGVLGPEEGFKTEWCFNEKVREPVVLHSFLKSQGLFLRRTPEEIGLTFGQPSKHIYTLDGDLEKLKEVQNVAKMLALSVLSGRVDTQSESEREFDWKLRHATGVAKAKPVAEFVRMLCEEGEKVLLAGWHRDVYDIWNKELDTLSPVMVTGSESPAQKEEARRRFMEDDNCRVLIISLRSGSGIDGLQHAAKTVVIGEFDWSPHVMDQIIARLDRDGQKHHVTAYFLAINDGADPFMSKVVNLKRSQHDGLVEGSEAEAFILAEQTAGRERIKMMAESYLASIGEEIPVAVKEEGLLGEVAAALRRVRVPANTEAEMQEALWSVLPTLLPDARVTREVAAGKRSRMDFLVEGEGERIGIECKIESRKRADVYRQVRRYAEEANVTALALYAPWSGVPSFIVDNIPVVVVDSAAAGF